MLYWLVRFLVFTLRRTSEPVAHRLARFYTKIFDLALPKLRKTARRNLEIAGYGRREDIIDGVFRSIARILVSVSRFPSIDASNIREYIDYEGFEHYEAAKRAGKGVLFATAHLGNWELSAFAHSLLCEPMHVVVRPLDDKAIDAFVEARRGSSGNHVISKRDAARDILKALKRNEPVGVLIDQNVAVDEGVFIDFFGVPACAGSAFARLAAHSKAAVLPGFALWKEDRQRYVLKFFPPVAITGDVAADTKSIQAVIEQTIRDHPDQWMWLHRRWKTRPPGEPHLY